MYHALDETPSVITIPPGVFAWQMSWLHENAYQVISLRQLVQLRLDNKPLPVRSVVITFDDGFESVYRDAFPSLARYGFPATVFLVGDYCGRYNDWPDQPATVPRLSLSTWSQIREMRRHGIEFGAHTLSHPWLDRLSAEEAEYEILTSKTIIEEHLGHAVNLFAYPYGRYNAVVKQIVEREFMGACGTRLGLVDLNSDPFTLERVEILYLTHPLLFQGLSGPFFSGYLNLRRLLRTTTSKIMRRPWQ